MPYIAPILQKVARILVTQIEYTFTNQKTELPQTPRGYGVPNKQFPTEMALDVRYTSDTTSKDTQRHSVLIKCP